MALRKRGDVIAKKATTIAIVNQKGGTAKTTTCENLGIGLAMEGKKVLLVDVDPQGSLTISMGWQQPDELSTTLSTLMQKAMNDQPIQPGDGILHHAEGVDLIPANIELAGMEVALVNSMNREKMLKQVLDSAKREYDYILLDCTPSLGMQNELGNAEPYFAATSPVLDLTVIRPDDAPHILPCFDEADEGISISEDEPLGFRYNPKQVIKLMGKRYLVGPVIFHRFDDDGNFASLTMSDMYAIQKYLESSSVTLMIDRDKLTCICID